MAIVKVDIPFNYIAKDDTQSDKNQLKTTRTFEGKDGIPRSTWRVSCESYSNLFSGKCWRLHVDLLEYEAFKNANVLATCKANLKLDYRDETKPRSRKVSEICQEFDLAATNLSDLKTGRVWSFERGTMATGRRYLVDVNITLICCKPLILTRASSVSKLQSDLADLFRNGLNTDLVLVAEDKEFRVHKIILSRRSTVFERMLEVDMKEKNENRIVIEDVKSDVLEKMLMFMYSGTLEENAETSGILEDLFTASEKYALTDLKELLAHKMCSGITIQNISRRFLLADQFGEKELRRKCFQFIRDHCDELSERDKSFLFCH